MHDHCKIRNEIKHSVNIKCRIYIHFLLNFLFSENCSHFSGYTQRLSLVHLTKLNFSKQLRKKLFSMISINYTEWQYYIISSKFGVYQFFAVMSSAQTQGLQECVNQTKFNQTEFQFKLNSTTKYSCHIFDGSCVQRKQCVKQRLI